ncbi:MAG: hypothetical protein MRY32_00565 [Rickettsiales bacterium]|nr:hypothetical protein [Rickettsiales bacterium]
MNPFFIAFLIMPLPVYALLRPTTSVRWRYTALIGMLLLGWGLLFADLRYGYHMNQLAYLECKERPAEFNLEHEDCWKIINIADGAALAFYYYLGWLPAAMYIGGWELAWRAIFWLHSRNSLHTLHAWWLGNTYIVLFGCAVLYVLGAYIRLLLR